MSFNLRSPRGRLRYNRFVELMHQALMPITLFFEVNYLT